MRFIPTIFVCGVVVGTGLSSATAADISGAGATFPYPIYAKWADAYKKETGSGLNYQSIGSGGGIKQIQAKTVAFGASDMPLGGPELEKDGLVQFPTVMGGVVPVINIEGFKPGELTLDGPTLARMFLGQIKTWNDPAIAKLNTGKSLPSQPVVVVHRADGSGTTFVFTDYLSKVSSDWKSKVGTNTAVEWPVGFGQKGNEGVAGNVGRVKGGIGYVEYAYAKQTKLNYTKVINADGKAVSPDAEGFSAAATNAKWEDTPGFGVVLTNQPGPASWPIAAATFILMHKKPQKPADSVEALKFFSWAYAKGGKMAEDLDFVPMPANVVTAIQKSWSEIKNEKGQPVFSFSN